MVYDRMRIVQEQLPLGYEAMLSEDGIGLDSDVSCTCPYLKPANLILF